MHKKTFLLLTIVLFFCTYASSQDVNAVKVFEKDGNIYAQASQEDPLKLTDTGRDSEPKLHPNGKWIYFVRTFEGEFVGEQYYPPKGKEPEDGILKEELWRIDVNGSNEKLLYQNTTAAIDHPSGYAYASLDNPQISPKGDKIYFETSHWVTSNALNVMDPDGSNVKMLGAGNSTKIILSTWDTDTDYSGYIVTNQHRYGHFGGSYDWWWLYDPEWNEIGVLGEDIKYFTGTWFIKYTDGSEKEITGEDY